MATDPDEIDLEDLAREAHDYARSGYRRFHASLAHLSLALIAAEPVDIPTWCTDNLFVPSEKTTRGGPMVLTPIQAAIARFWQTPGVEQVTFLKPPRIGSSFLNAAGLLYYSAHEAQDTIFYERSEQTAQEFNNDKLMPIFRSSVSVASLIRPDSKAGEQDRWTDRMLMNGAGLKMRSVSNNGAFRGIRGRFICADEAGSPEYNASGKRSEGSKVDLIKRRGQEFADFVLYLGGTPTRVGECNVSAEFEKSDKREFVMTAPCCDHRQAFAPDVRHAVDPAVRYGPGLRYSVDQRGVPNDAWYECAGCGERIEETSKVSMMATGVFEATTVGDRGHIGVYVWSAHSTDPKSDWKRIAEAHQKAERDPDLKQNFDNMWLARAHNPSSSKVVDPSSLEARVETWTTPDGTRVDLPAWAEMMSAGIDCQQGSLDDSSKPPRVEITVTVTGANRRRAVVRHEIIAHRDVVDAFTGEIERVPVEPFTAACSDLIWDFLDRTWTTEDGRTLRIGATFVDNGWHPDDAQRFCMLPRSRQLGIVPIRGASTERNGSRAPLLPAGLKLRRSQRSGREYLFIGTQTAKDTIGRILSIPAPGPESVVFGDGLPTGYFQGLLAEREVEIRPGVRVWRPIAKAETGEPWDCLVYAYAAERYQVMRSKRLKKLVDEIAPEAVEAALAVEAETRAAVAPPAIAPAPEPAATCLSGDAVVHSASEQPAERRFRVLTKEERRAASGVQSTQDTAARTARIERVRRRNGSTGIGW